MRKKGILFKTTALIVLAFSGALILFNCHKNEVKSNNSHPNGNEFQVGSKFYVIKNFSEHQSKSTGNSGSNLSQRRTRTSSNDLSQINADISQSDLESMLSDLKDHFNGDLNSMSGTPYVITIYAKPSLNNLEYDKIEAISVIMAQPASAFNYFFQINSNLAVKIPDWSKALTTIHNYQLQYLGSVFATDNNSGLVIFTSLTNSPIDYSNTIPVNDFNTVFANTVNLPNLYFDSPCIAPSHCNILGDDCAQGGSGWKCNAINPPDTECVLFSTQRIFSISNLPPISVDTVKTIQDSILGKLCLRKKIYCFL